MWAFRSFRRSRGLKALTEAWVPTGMKTGVSMTPWAVCSSPARAPVSGHRAWISKRRADMQAHFRPLPIKARKTGAHLRLLRLRFRPRPMSLRFYNTLTQELEDFHPLEGNTVRMYTCGPTVYNFAHIGNFRAFTFEDILRRWLRYRGYQLNHVMNVTDVDDKIIVNAAQAKKSIKDYTAAFTQAFFEDAAA